MIRPPPPFQASPCRATCSPFIVDISLSSKSNGRLGPVAVGRRLIREDRKSKPAVSLLYSFPLGFRPDSLHIPGHDRSPKSSPKKPSTPSGFEEAPQAPLSGTPLSGNVSDWVKQLEAEAETSAFESQREIASKAGKHRKKVEITASKAAAKTVAGKTARGTSMGGSHDPKTRAAAGLNPVAGLDVSLEDADKLTTGSGVTATVEALAALIESGNPLFKDGKLWTPHRPARPDKSEGGISLKMVTDYQPSGDQPTAIADLVDGLSPASATRCCSASPAPAKPSPWPR